MLYTVDEEKTAILITCIVLVIYLFALGIGLANYIMRSLALYRIASRRQVPNPWLSWVPVASSWLIGNIADDYDERNGIKRKWRVVLLTLSIISIGGIVIGYIGLVIWALRITMESSLSRVPEDITGMITSVIVVYIFIIIAAVVAMAKSFCDTICIYKIFESTVPEKSVKYLLLHLLVPLAGSICLLKCKEKGYSKEIIPAAGYPFYTGMVQEEIPEKTDSEETDSEK